MLSLQSKKPKLHEKVTNIQKNRKWNWLKDGGYQFENAKSTRVFQGGFVFGRLNHLSGRHKPLLGERMAL
jgi:hypothetical protein